LFSEDFQKYADRTKSPWTCEIENITGNLQVIMSSYQRGYVFFQHVIKRCPDTPMAEEAEFKTAQCLEGMGRAWDSVASYERYAEKYKTNPRARLATKAATAIRLGL
jgi:TolA-binding protein